MASKKLPQELENKKPRSLRRILDTENPKVIIELTEEKIDLVEFVEYVLNFENGVGE
jgi:hypothetical protein